MSREMKESGVDWIGEIPKNWKIIRTKSAFKNHKTIAGEKSSQYERLALTLNGVIKRSKDDSTGLQPEAFDGYQILRPGELVFKLIDLENLQTSRVGLSPYEGIVSPAYIIIEPNTQKVIPEYAELYFLSMWHRAIFNHMGDDGVRSSLNSKDLLETPFTLPSIEEQRKISSFLRKKCSNIDQVICDTENSINEFRRLRQSIITEAVTKGLHEQHKMKESGIEWIGRIPEHWGMMRMKNCIKSHMSGSWGSDPKKDGGDIVCMRIADFDYDRLSFVKSEKYTIRNYDKATIEKLKLKDGDILIEKSGGGDKTPVGRAVVYKLGFDALYANFMDKIICKKDYDPRWFAYVFAAFYQNGFIKKYIKQTTGIQNLDLPAMLSCERIPIPPKDEQVEIASNLDIKCDRINDFIDKKTTFMNELSEYKKSIIYEYITGKKEVPEL